MSAPRRTSTFGLGLKQGDHVCAFYLGPEERDEVLLPYLLAGLEGGDKCICIVDAGDPSQLLAQLGSELGVEHLDGCVEDHQLEMRTSEDTYFSSGGFTSKGMLDFWDRSLSALGEDGLASIRVVGEMTWALRDIPGVGELMLYESELNRLTPRYPQAIILCLYDLQRFGGGVVVDLVKTHAKVILGGMMFENPHHLLPDEFLASSS